MMDQAVEHLGGLDVLGQQCRIAGPTGRVEEIAPEEWDRCRRVCLTSQFNCARLAVPHLARASSNGSIVNLSSRPQVPASACAAPTRPRNGG